MIISFEIENQNYKISAENPLDISIPLKFNGVQPNAYGVEKASSKPCEAGSLIGDTRRGGSCNFEQYNFIPHCNGTHTECVGHITNERISVRDCLQDIFIPANLISVEPEKTNDVEDTYSIDLNQNDLLITRKSIESAFQISDFRFRISDSFALIIRTLPNDESKLSQTYLKEIPPFFSTEAMQFIKEIGVKHLICDLPSIDRIFDEGKLSNHRIFWNVEPGSFDLKKDSFVKKTITELAFISNEIKDGNYLLNLQIAPFEADASPSRPLLFELL